VEPQTYSLLSALSSRESIDLVLALLERSGSVEDLARRTSIPSATVSRRLRELAFAGVVSRERPRDPFTLTCAEETRRVLEAVGSLALEVLRVRHAEEETLQRTIRKTRLQPTTELDDLPRQA
jgi:DNA-binding IclR family transcriptional regulator